MTNNRSSALKSFLKVSKDLELTIEFEDGLYRNLLFKRPETSAYSFKITTWPGHLAITGDMGCSVFSRTHDMFKFFRESASCIGVAGGNLPINPRYWVQKCVANDGDKEEFDIDRLRSYVEECIQDHLDGLDMSSFDDADELIKALRQLLDPVMSAENDQQVYYAVNEIDTETIVSEDGRTPFKYFNLDDMWECNFKDLTHHFYWRCFAIAYAVQAYDALGKSDD